MKINNVILALVILMFFPACKQVNGGEVVFRQITPNRHITKYSLQFTNPVTIESIDGQTAFNREFAGTGLRFDYSFYTDSMIVGIIDTTFISVSSQMNIDSLVIHGSNIMVHTTIHNPDGALSHKAFNSVFAVIARTEFDFTMAPGRISIPAKSNNRLRFTTVMKESNHILSDYDAEPEVWAIRSIDDELTFLINNDVANTFLFPDVNYADSMLVIAKLPMKYSSSTQFEIVSIDYLENSINVEAHQWSPFYSTPDIAAPGHIIKVERRSGDINLNIKSLN